MSQIFKYNLKRDFLSIVIPVYNDPEGLIDTISSLLNQTLDRNKYEIIVANDGDIEDISQICNQFNIKTVSLNPKKGSYSARNKALYYAKGEYILFIDADIKVPKEFLKIGIDLLKNYDYIGGQVLIDKSKIETITHYFEYLCSFNIKKNLVKDHFIPTAYLFIDRNILMTLGNFDGRLRSGGDLEFGNRVFDSRRFKMHYSKKIYAIHPPKGLKALIRKHIRITTGSLVLANMYPKRFSYLRFGLIKLIKILIAPTFWVIKSNRPINAPIRIKLVFWAIGFGLINFYNTLSKISPQ
ncbi:MAG: glycosyltransferase [Candidatus Lokiarchaeota archaeon]|nr:glycosyltransferase [Candidatus Lokiarchaeota archaeon]